MLSLVRLELTKVKRTSMGKIIAALTLLPSVLILIQYLCLRDDNQDFFDTVAKNNIVITMCLYTVLIIFSSYVFAREYQDKTYIYLFITPKSKRRIFAAKFLVVCVELLVSFVCSYGIILLMSVFLGGAKGDVIEKLLLALVCGVIMYLLVMPIIVAITIWKKNFVSSILIALVILIFTTPFMFKENFYMFPHLIPMAVGNNILMKEALFEINYGLVIGILLGVFVIFSILSLRLFEKKE